MTTSHRISKLAFCSLTLLLAVAAFSATGVHEAQANPISCGDLKNEVTARNESIRAQLDAKLAGQKHKLLINKLVIQGVSSVSLGDRDCAITMVLNAKIDRKIRNDAEGTITVRVQASGSRNGSGLDLSFSQPHVLDISLSGTKGITEKVYKVFANQLVQSSTEIHVD